MKTTLFLISISVGITFGQTIKTKPKLDSICGTKINRDANGKLLPRYFPNNVGKAYQKVIKLTSDFVLYHQPVDKRAGKTMLYTTCCFEGPHMKKGNDIVQGKSIGGNKAANFDAVDWMHNPAVVFSGFTQSLALDLYPYTGNKDLLTLVGQMLDYQIKYGSTPANFAWANVPYASSDPKDTVYQGALMLEHEGMRGDGLHGIEPDKLGDMGYAYIKYFQITGDKKYVTAALNCADALAKFVKKDALPAYGNFVATQTKYSPWAFRLNARTGKVYDTYCSNVIEPIKLFDELLRIQKNIALDTSRIRKYKETRDVAWTWLFSKSGPMKTYVWNGYFEDIIGDEFQSNRIQTTPMETARYLLKNPQEVSNLDIHIQALIYYIKSAFGDETIDAIKEQTWCYEPMASHSARYASVCAMFYEKTKNEWFKEEALRNFNYGTYAVEESGAAWVGHTWPGSWWSDGYSDFIKHYFDGMAAIPEWAPAGEDHLIKSTSAVLNIAYSPTKISFKTYDNQSAVTLRLSSKPKSVSVNGKNLIEKKDLQSEGFVWNQIGNEGAIKINYSSGNEIVILK